MRITDSVIAMNARHSSLSRNETKESLNVWTTPQNAAPSEARDQVQFSAHAQKRLQEMNSASEAQIQDSQTTGLESSLKKLVVEILSGREVNIMHPSDLHSPQQNGELEQSIKRNTAEENSSTGWGLEYNRQETHIEQETMSVQATGVIRTADNKEIAFGLNLEMSREYISQSTVELRAGDALIDPLVINYAGGAAELTGKTFSFDLNADGIADNMPELSIGRGYLALDKDGDGVINSGEELFGPNSGDGFSELAAYDNDKNQWIDESDAVFSRLSVMSLRDGQTTLSSLSELGVGAIYVGSIDSPFELRDANNDLQAKIGTTGVFLKEDGEAGTIQHLDVVI